MADPRSLGIGLKQSIDILGLQPNQRSPLHLSRLASFLRSQEGFFTSLSHTDTEVVGKWLDHEYVYPGQPVYEKGDFGESMYIVVGGACEVLAPDHDAHSDASQRPRELLVAGQSFGELALVCPRKPRTATVISSPAAGGAHLVVINRSALSSLRYMGAAQADASHALQSLLCACCLRVLRLGPGRRSPDDVEMLAEFMANMEAFKKLPADMIRRLAADCSHVRLPPGRVLFEEDAPGNTMYVVVSGQCQVRARPLAMRHKAAVAGGTRSALRPGSLGIGMTMTPRRLVAGGVGGRSFIDATTPRSMVSFASSSMAGAVTETTGPGSGGASVVRYGGIGRVATVLTIRADRRRQTGSGAAAMAAGAAAGDDEDDADEDENGKTPTTATARHSSGSGTANKDSPFWIARFMEDTLKRLHLSDSSAGLGQQMTPLAAVAAARWRQAAASRRVSAVAAEGPRSRGGDGGGGSDGVAAGPDEEEVAEEEGMEALLGRAAARALKQAMTEQRARKGHNYSADGHEPIPGADGGGTAATAATAPASPSHVSFAGRGRAAAAAVTAPTAPAAAAAAAAPPPMRRITVTDDVNADDVCIGAASTPTGAPTGAAAAAAVPHLPAVAPAAAPAVALEDPAKRLLSKIGNRDPANVSRTLLTELVQRADVGVVLYEVAKKLVRRGGGPRRINHSTSKKINRALHQQIRAGPDRLQGTLQGQRVLGKHSTVTASRGSSLWQRGIAASMLLSSHRPASRHGGGGGGGGGGRSDHHFGGPQAAESSVWGDAPSVQTSQYPRSLHGGSGTRPASALTSGVSGFVDLDLGESGDDVSEVDWNGSDLYSLASYKPSTAASHGTGRRVTSGDMDHTTLINADLMSSSELEVMYGPVIRRITPGQSFGELALLHRDSRRTATIITASAGSPSPPSSTPASPSSPRCGPEQPVDLICITRHTYNHTVRASQVAQLQGLLGFLARQSPFRALDDQQRAALAVFCRQREVAAGAVLAVQGEPADTLWMIQEGEVVLLDSSAAVLEPLLFRPGNIRPPPPPPPPMRAASQPTLLTASVPAANATGLDGGGGGGASWNPVADGGGVIGSGGRGLLRQLSAPETGGSSAGRMARSLKPAALGVRKDSSMHRRVMFDSGASSASSASAGGGGGADGPLRHVAPGALMALGGALTSMGPGGMFGESLLTTMTSAVTAAAAPPPSQQVQQLTVAATAAAAPAGEDEEAAAAAAARGRKGRGRGLTSFVPPPYPCTVIARRPTKVLTISANDLSRFADAVAAPLAALAAARGELLAARSASVNAAKEAVSERVSNARRVLRTMRLAQNPEVAALFPYPGLAADLKLAAEESAAEAAAAAAAVAAAIAAASGPASSGIRTPSSSGALSSSPSTMSVASSSRATSTAGRRTPLEAAAAASSKAATAGRRSSGTGSASPSAAVDHRGVVRLTGATRGLRELAASWGTNGSGGSSGSTTHSVSGRKSAQILLPGALLRRLESKIGKLAAAGGGGAAAAAAAAMAAGAATAAAAAEALKDSCTSAPPEPHRAGDRLSALLYDSTPRLPEAAAEAAPPRMADPRATLDGSDDAAPTPMDAAALWPFFELAAGGGGTAAAAGAAAAAGVGVGGHYLATITEESSSGLRNAGSLLASGGGGGLLVGQGSGGSSLRLSRGELSLRTALLEAPAAGAAAVAVTGGATAGAASAAAGLHEGDDEEEAVWRNEDAVDRRSSAGGALGGYFVFGAAGLSEEVVEEVDREEVDREEDEEEEEEGLFTSRDMDPLDESLGTVEEGDEEAALEEEEMERLVAEREEEEAGEEGEAEAEGEAAVAPDGPRAAGAPVLASRAAPAAVAAAAVVVEQEVPKEAPRRPQLPPLRLPIPIRSSNSSFTDASAAAAAATASAAPAVPAATTATTDASAAAAAATAAAAASPPLPPLLRLPSAPSSRRRPHSSTSIPTADGAAGSASSSPHVADDYLPPLLHPRQPRLRSSAPPPSAPPAVHRPRPIAPLPQPIPPYSAVRVQYVDISPVTSASTTMAEAVEAAALAAAASSPRRYRPWSAGETEGTSFRTRYSGSAGSDGAGSDSLLIYSDEGSASPDLSNVRLENAVAAKRGGAVDVDFGSAGRTPAPPRRGDTAASDMSDGLSLLSGFTSVSPTSAATGTGASAAPVPMSALLAAAAAAAAAAGVAAGVAAVRGMPEYSSGPVSSSAYGSASGSASRSGSEDGTTTIMEAQGASLDRLVGGRPPRSGSRGSIVSRGSGSGSGSVENFLSGGSSAIGGSSSSSSINSGAMAPPVAINGSGSGLVRMSASPPRQAAAATDAAAAATVTAATAVETEAGSAGEAQTPSSSSSPSALAVAAPLPPPATLSIGSDATPDVSRLTTTTAAADDDDAPLPPDTIAAVQAEPTCADVGGAAAPSAAAPPAAAAATDGAANFTVDGAESSWPILPWTHLDHRSSTPRLGQPPPPPSLWVPAPPGFEHFFMSHPGGEQLYGGGGAAPDPPPPPLPVLKPLQLTALRRQLATEEGDVMSGPQSCSPRAGLTDSPQRARGLHAPAGLLDSPVHSPRMVSQVY